MINGLIIALQFLTRIPLNISIDYNKKNVSKSTFFFPVAGLIIGAFSAATYYITSFEGRDIAAFSAVLMMIFVTGGLHIDGLSDTCDGFFSSRSKERILEIMKDSRTGTFGVIAIVLDILAKYILISKLQQGIFIVLPLSCANARLTSVMLISYMKNARSGGMGALFSESGTKKYFWSALIAYATFIFMFLGAKYLIPLGATVICALLISLKSYKTIGGLTGDVYGTNTELGEIVSVAVFLAVIK